MCPTCPLSIGLVVLVSLGGGRNLDGDLFITLVLKDTLDRKRSANPQVGDGSGSGRKG